MDGSITIQLRGYALATILVELFSGITATIWTAFFNEKEVDKWAYFIFISYILFVSAMAFPTIKELPLRRSCDCQAPIDDKRLTVKTYFILWAWTLVTLGVDLAVYYYNKKILNESSLSLILILPFICYGYGISIFVSGYCQTVQLSAAVAQFPLIFGLGITLLGGIFVASLPLILSYQHVNVGGYIVLGIYVAYALLTLYFFIKEVLSGYQQTQYVQLFLLFASLLVTLFYGLIVLIYMLFGVDDPDESIVKVFRAYFLGVTLVVFSLGGIMYALAWTPRIVLPTSQSDANIEGGINEQMTNERVNVDEECPDVT